MFNGYIPRVPKALKAEGKQLTLTMASKTRRQMHGIFGERERTEHVQQFLSQLCCCLAVHGSSEHWASINTSLRVSRPVVPLSFPLTSDGRRLPVSAAAEAGRRRDPFLGS